MTEYDSRQYNMMLGILERYGKTTNLNSMIVNLEALLGCLEERDEEWSNSFYSSLGIIEEYYAVALDRNEALPPKSLDMITKSVNNLKTMVMNKLSTT